jgi:hypothetical protein
MKVLFMFFALLNAAFFVWQADVFNLRADEGTTRQLAQNDKIPKLTMLTDTSKEKLEAKRKAEQKAKTQLAKANPRPSSPGKSVCYALGPFDGLPQAKNISEKLQDLGAFTFERSVTTESPMGYWVYLDSYDSWKEAREKVVSLEIEGLKDMFIVGRGPMKNAVSLGLYKSEDGAKERIERLKKMGEEPKIQTQYKQSDQYWIDIDIDPNQKQAIATIEKIAQSLTVLELNKRTCD